MLLEVRAIYPFLLPACLHTARCPNAMQEGAVEKLMAFVVRSREGDSVALAMDEFDPRVTWLPPRTVADDETAVRSFRVMVRASRVQCCRSHASADSPLG